MKNSKLQVSGHNFSAPTIKRLEICAQQGDVRLVMKLLNVFAVIALIIICVVQFAFLNQMSESVVRSSAAHIDLKEKLEQTIESNREVLMEFDREFDRFRKTLLSYSTKESRNMAMQGKHMEKSIKTEISLAKSQMLIITLIDQSAELEELLNPIEKAYIEDIKDYSRRTLDRFYLIKEAADEANAPNK